MMQWRSYSERRTGNSTRLYAPSMSMVCTSLIQCRQEGPVNRGKRYESESSMIARSELCKEREAEDTRLT